MLKKYLIHRLVLRNVSDKDKRKLRVGKARPPNGTILGARLQRIIVKNGGWWHQDYRMASVVLRPGLIMK